MWHSSADPGLKDRIRMAMNLWVRWAIRGETAFALGYPLAVRIETRAKGRGVDSTGLGLVGLCRRWGLLGWMAW